MTEEQLVVAIKDLELLPRWSESGLKKLADYLRLGHRIEKETGMPAAEILARMTGARASETERGR